MTNSLYRLHDLKNVPSSLCCFAQSPSALCSFMPLMSKNLLGTALCVSDRVESCVWENAQFRWALSDLEVTAYIRLNKGWITGA